MAHPPSHAPGAARILRKSRSRSHVNPIRAVTVARHLERPRRHAARVCCIR
jgi:hypothetical protein